MIELPKIYPITNVEISGLSHIEQVEQLIKGGAKLIQIREKKATSRDFFEQAKICVEIAKKSDAKILINDRIDIALAVKADGVHLGQDDLSPIYAREILGESAIIGFSTHSVSQAIEAVKLPIDYVAIGPIYQTTTKENPDEIVGLKGLHEVRKAIEKFPLVAIGGIKSENIREVLQNGADSVALISEILSESQGIAGKMKKLIELSS
jgi:thiamine-phosphate pyrophosphorylase